MGLKNTNQVNGVSVQKMGGDLCTMTPDGHYFNVSYRKNKCSNRENLAYIAVFFMKINQKSFKTS